MSSNSTTRPASRLPIRGTVGFTLLEMIVAISVIALVVGLVIPSVDSLTGARLKTTASKLALTIKYIFNRSAMTNQHFRMVFDMDKNSWWVEAADGRFSLKQKQYYVGEEEEEEKKAKEEEKEERERNEGIEPESKTLMEQQLDSKKKRTAFRSFSEKKMIKKEKLPQGIEIQGVLTAHQEEIFEDSKAYLYFFPSGYVEQAYIYLGDDANDIYTLVVQPLTGKAKVYNERKEPIRD